MATKKATTPEYLKIVDEKIDQSIATAGKIYDTTYQVTETLVDEAYRAGNEWNKILQKAVKGGVKIYGKQQEIALDALEGIVSQYGKSAQRFQKLIGFNIMKEVKAKTAEAKDAIENVIANVSDKIEHSMQDVEAKAKASVKEAKKTINKTKKTIEDTASQMEDKAAKMTASPKKTKKAVKAKTVKKVKATTKTIGSTARKAKAAQLTDITGVGPKTMQILSEGGIKTIAQLAKASQKKIDTILEGKGKIYATVDTKQWINEAKKIAK